MAAAFSTIIDHAARAVARVVFQFRNKAYIEGIVSAIADEVQALETALFNLQAVRQISALEGAALDGLAAMLGTPHRGDKSDYLYQLRTQAQVRINRSSGSIPEIYQIAGLIVAEWLADGSKLITESNAAYKIECFPLYSITNDPDAALELAYVLADASPAGVRSLVYSRNTLIGGGSAFRFSGGSGASAGFGVGKFRQVYEG